MASESEQEKRETLADIAAEFRAMPSDIIIDAKADFVFSRYADRIEAALKREREAVLADAERLGRGRFEVVYASERCDREAVTGRNQFGNAAAMREALRALRDASRDFYNQILNSKYSEILDKYTCVKQGFPAVLDLRSAFPMANAALSEPARNCDLPLVVDGPASNNADKAWLVFKRHNPDAYFDVSGLLRCIDWLLAPAAERKGEGA